MERRRFVKAAQADSFRSALMTAARKGEAFSLGTGRPTAWERTKADTTWYEFACAYLDMKWKLASARYRKDIARALTAATPAMLTDARGRTRCSRHPASAHALGLQHQAARRPAADVAEVLSWIAPNSTPLSALADATVARKVLHLATGRVDGTVAAASTARRHRTILANAMDYAVELNLLDSNPIRALKWTAPKSIRPGGPPLRGKPGSGAGAARCSPLPATRAGLASWPSSG